ncbi:hypothetical protein Tco_1215199 [Tanacetum coccineum]
MSRPRIFGSQMDCPLDARGPLLWRPLFRPQPSPIDDVLLAEEQPLTAAWSHATADLNQSSRDVADDEEDEDEEEEEHLAPTNSILPPTCRTTARMSIRDQTPIPFSPAAELLHHPPTSKHLDQRHHPSGAPPLLPIPLPTPSPPLLLPSTVGKSSSAPTAGPTRGFRPDCGFVSTLDDEIKRDPEREDTTDEIKEELDECKG